MLLISKSLLDLRLVFSFTNKLVNGFLAQYRFSLMKVFISMVIGVEVDQKLYCVRGIFVEIAIIEYQFCT